MTRSPILALALVLAACSTGEVKLRDPDPKTDDTGIVVDDTGTDDTGSGSADGGTDDTGSADGGSDDTGSADGGTDDTGSGSADGGTDDTGKPVLTDVDGDGFYADDPDVGLVDCDDANAAVNPFADEVCNDIDDDCDGVVDGADALDATVWYWDSDRDGYGLDDDYVIGCTLPSGYDPHNYASEAGDCDDTDATVNPGAEEIVNSVDDDCDSLEDEGTEVYDDDGDGWAEAAGDCNDADATVNPEATETWYDGVDQDCAGDNDYDADADGYDSDAWFGEDCDDADAGVNTSVWEDNSDGVDNNCNSQTDEFDFEVTWTLSDVTIILYDYPPGLLTDDTEAEMEFLYGPGGLGSVGSHAFTMTASGYTASVDGDTLVYNQPITWSSPDFDPDDYTWGHRIIPVDGPCYYDVGWATLGESTSGCSSL